LGVIAVRFKSVRRFFFAWVLVAIPALASAQVIPPSAQPGRERERFTQPPVPRAQPGGPAVSLPSTEAPPGADKVKIVIRGVRVTGSTIYRADQLRETYADLLAKATTLQTVYEIARRITARYGSDGYVLSRAIVPPQKFSPNGAIIHIQVIEGWINKIEWPKSLSRYRDFFSDYTARIIADRPVNVRTIERYLLLASDLPGLTFSTALRPSDQPGASILVVNVTEKPIDAIGRIDNRGTPSQGPFEFLGSATFNNTFGQHEAFTLTYAGALPLKELQYVAGNYRQVLTSEGLTAFADASYSWGKPGTAILETLQYDTHTTFAEAGVLYPVIRSRERNLTVTGLIYMNDSYSNILQAPFNVDRIRGFRGKADADIADSMRGINQFNVTVSQGINGLGSTNNGNPLASRAAGRVDYTKIEGTIGRLQPLPAHFSTYASIYGQYAGTSLLSPEQCGYGGRFFGRAYDPSELLGDSCWKVLGEFRYDMMPAVPQITLAQLYTYIDYGRLYTRNPTVGTDASTHGASAGAGLRLAALKQFTADLQVAKAIAGERNDWRFFFIIGANY
jgi:hemolysin activation/secretion protein